MVASDLASILSLLVPGTATPIARRERSPSPPPPLPPPPEPAASVSSVAASRVVRRHVAKPVVDMLSASDWGVFRITPKQPGGGTWTGGAFGGFSARCPFHKLSNKTGCKKWSRIRGPSAEDREAAYLRVLFWCSQARSFDRQRHHVACELPDVLPSWEFIQGCRIDEGLLAQTDEYWDAAEAAAGGSGAASSHEPQSFPGFACLIFGGPLTVTSCPLCKIGAFGGLGKEGQIWPPQTVVGSERFEPLLRNVLCQRSRLGVIPKHVCSLADALWLYRVYLFGDSCMCSAHDYMPPTMELSL
jgi:hypothetical protein